MSSIARASRPHRRLSPVVALLVFCLALLSSSSLVKAEDDAADTFSFPPLITSDSGAALYPRSTSATNSTLYFSFSSSAAIPASAQLSLTLGSAVHTATSSPLCSINGAPVAAAALAPATGVLTVTPAAAIAASASTALVCTGLALAPADVAATALGQAVVADTEGAIVAAGAGIQLSGAYSSSALARHAKLRVIQGRTYARGKTVSDNEDDDDDDEDEDEGHGLIIGALGTLEITLAGSFPLSLPAGSVMRLDFPTAAWGVEAVAGCNVASDGGAVMAAGVMVTAAEPPAEGGGDGGNEEVDGGGEGEGEGESASVASAADGVGGSIEITMPVAASTSSAPGAGTTITCHLIRAPPTAAAASQLTVSLAHPAFTVGAGALPSTALATVKLPLPAATLPGSAGLSTLRDTIEQVLTLEGIGRLLNQQQLNTVLTEYLAAMVSSGVRITDPFALVQTLTGRDLRVTIRSLPPSGGLIGALLGLIGSLLTGVVRTLDNTLGFLGAPIKLSGAVQVGHLLTCLDGVRNELETGIDCGGPVCQACAEGKGCAVNGDCLSSNCLQGQCRAPGETLPPGPDDGEGEGPGNAAGAAGVSWATVALLGAAAAAVTIVGSTGAGAGAVGLVEMGADESASAATAAAAAPEGEAKGKRKGKGKVARSRKNRSN